jgi:hypothetical protein
MCLAERRPQERGSNLTLAMNGALQMRPVDMCATSMCSFVQHVSTREYHTYAFVDDGTDASIRRLYRESGVRTISAFTGGFPRPDSIFPQERPYTWLKLLLWNFTRYKTVVWFDSDIWFVGSPVYLFHKYPLPRTNSMMWVRNRWNWNSGLIMVRPYRLLFQRLLALYQAEIIGRGGKLNATCCHRGGSISCCCCDAEQTWLIYHLNLFSVVRGDVCDNNKWETEGMCPNATHYHYLPVRLAPKLEGWRVAVDNRTCAAAPVREIEGCRRHTGHVSVVPDLVARPDGLPPDSDRCLDANGRG